MRAFIPAFEKQRVLSKTVNTQMFQGKFEPSSGDYVDIKRPHQYLAQRTAGGDISGGTDNSIISGKATAQVQDYITVPIPWTNKQEALELDQLEEIIKPAAETCNIELETSFNDFMIANAGLSVGVPGTAVDAWSDVAAAMTQMNAIGVPTGEHYYVMNPYTVQALASVQAGLSADPSRLVQTAWEKAQISQPFAGMQAIVSNSMSTRVNTLAADLTGALTATPDATYVTAKDTMTQSLAVAALTNDAVVKAGSIIEFTGTGADARSRIHLRTGKTIFDNSGNVVKWRAVVTADVTLSATGTGTLVVAGPAINETNGQYNTISTKLLDTDVFTIIGTSGVEYQPNLYYTKDAYAIAFVKLPKLYNTDTVAVTADGISIRVSRYSDGDKNTQKVRFDLLPAFGVLNPFWSGQGYGA